MGEARTKYDVDFKKNEVKLSHASPKSVKEIAEDLGIFHSDSGSQYTSKAVMNSTDCIRASRVLLCLVITPDRKASLQQ